MGQNNRLEEVLARFMESTERFMENTEQFMVRTDQLLADNAAHLKAMEVRTERELQAVHEHIAAMDARAERERQAMDARAEKELQAVREHIAAMDARAERELQTIREHVAAMDARAARDRAAMREEAARARDKWGKQWGDLSNKLGTIVEDLVAPNIPRIAREVFGWSDVADLSIRRKKRKRDRSGRREFDVIAVDEDALIVNETKSTARVDYIDKFVEVLADIFEYFPEHTGKKVIPVFAPLYIDESLVQYLTRQGIYAMVLRGDTMEVVNYEEVQKRNRARGKVRDEEQLSEEVI